jgi:ABC-type xylose transport system permease subunit
MVRLSALAAAALLPFTSSAFSVSDASVSRREAFAKTATTLIGGSIAGSLVGVPSAVAVVTDETPKVISRMGGLLVRPMQTHLSTRIASNCSVCSSVKSFHRKDTKILVDGKSSRLQDGIVSMEK